MKTATRKLTLSQAFEEHYLSSELSKHNVATFRCTLRFWERVMKSPDIHKIDNAMVAAFREEAQQELAPYSVNQYWNRLRSVLRRLGPVTDGNPWALEIIDRVPAMRPVKVPFKRPKRLSTEELSRIYLACRWMKFPCRNVPNPAFWWQAMIVLAYNTGLRVSDLLKAEWSHLDTKERTLFVRVKKTGVEADLPLTDCTMEHLGRLQQTPGKIFHIYERRFYQYTSQLREQAKVDFTLHDVRRTAASEIDRVDRGLGKVLLLHAPNGVTEKSYLNALPELREAVDKMEVPLAFKHGPKMVLRALNDSKRTILKSSEFLAPLHPPAELFSFTSTGFSFAGRFYAASPMRTKVIRTFVENGCDVSQETLWRALYPGKVFPLGKAREDRLQLMRDLSSTRPFLRRVLKLPEGYNPLVATLLENSGNQHSPQPVGKRLCRYEMFLPPALWQNAKGGAG